MFPDICIDHRISLFDAANTSPHFADKEHIFLETSSRQPSSRRQGGGVRMSYLCTHREALLVLAFFQCNCCQVEIRGQANSGQASFVLLRCIARHTVRK
jgi:hypothetical protein